MMRVYVSCLSAGGEIGLVDGQQGDDVKGVTLTGHKGLADKSLFDVWSDWSGDADIQTCEFKDYALNDG